MTLPSLPFVVLDTETTGFVPRTHRVIEFACVRVVNGKIETEYEQLFANAEVPPHVEVLTRIRTANLREKPSFAEKKAEMLALMPEGTLIVGQNVGFDLGMLKGEDMDLTGYPWIDTSMLASLVFPELESYSLGYLSTVLRLDHTPKHRALGDVRATLALLNKCCERLLELPPELQKNADEIIKRGSKGYQMLFASLIEQRANEKRSTKPSWLHTSPSNHPTSNISPIHIPTPSPTTIALLEEPLDPSFPEQIIRGAIENTKTLHWIAVKNLRAALRRLPALPGKDVRVLHPPSFLLDPDARTRFETQETYTPDETTLALKLAWYEPKTRDDLPLHGGEEAVWNGKLACTDACKTYRKQFDELPGVVLLDHREFLRFLDAEDHPGHKSLQGDTHVIVDDASMLEDTATKAYGWMCVTDDMRASAQGNPLLTHFLDTLQLWIEKIRQGQDIRYLTENDLRTPETRGLRDMLKTMCEKDEWAEQIARSLSDLKKILEPENLAHRLAWIEQRPNGGQFVQSVPERIGAFLTQNFFGHLPATLLIPQGSSQMLPEIIPDAIKTTPASAEGSVPHAGIPLSFSAEPTLEALFQNPPAGKTVILLPGKGAIEVLFVKYMEELEKKGVTLICQGMSGGQGRMQAEFLAAPAPVLWLLTPWMFEGMELPQGSIDHLLLKTLPFDHPAHPVLSRRSSRYRDAFGDYCLPRLLHRLFRIIRTYCRFRTVNGDLRILDERLHTKAYGKKVKEYLNRFATTDQAQSVQTVTASHTSTGVSKKSKKDPKAQMTLF